MTQSGSPYFLQKATAASCGHTANCWIVSLATPQCHARRCACNNMTHIQCCTTPAVHSEHNTWNIFSRGEHTSGLSPKRSSILPVRPPPISTVVTSTKGRAAPLLPGSAVNIRAVVSWPPRPSASRNTNLVRDYQPAGLCVVSTSGGLWTSWLQMTDTVSHALAVPSQCTSGCLPPTHLLQVQPHCCQRSRLLRSCLPAVRKLLLKALAYGTLDVN